jgi:hypothetical protein
LVLDLRRGYFQITIILTNIFIFMNVGNEIINPQYIAK